MKNLEIHTAKDVAIKDLICTPNVILLAKQRTNVNAKGEVSTTVRYIEVCGIDKTDGLAIVQSLLKYCIAEFLVCNELERDFSETNIKQRKLFNQFLSGDTIYRTNSEGKVANALISEIPLRQTALNVKDYHTIATCRPENRKAAIYKHAKAIIAQCKYLRLIVDKVDEIDQEGTAKSPKADRPARKPTTGATAYVPTPPAMVAAPAAM